MWFASLDKDGNIFFNSNIIYIIFQFCSFVVHFFLIIAVKLKNDEGLNFFQQQSSFSFRRNNERDAE